MNSQLLWILFGVGVFILVCGIILFLNKDRWKLPKHVPEPNLGKPVYWVDINLERAKTIQLCDDRLRTIIMLTEKLNDATRTIKKHNEFLMQKGLSLDITIDSDLEIWEDLNRQFAEQYYRCKP